MNRHPKRHFTAWRGTRPGRFTACGLLITERLAPRVTLNARLVTCALCTRTYEWSGEARSALPR